jgi:hypothetical protein
MTPSRVRWGIFWILVGLVFLANNLGWLSWWVWADLLHLWPVLLIAIGLEMIVKKSKIQWLGFLSTLLIIGAFAWAISQNEGFGYSDFGFISPSQTEVRCDNQEATAAGIKVRFSDGRLRFSSGDNYLFMARSRNSRDAVALDSDCDNGYCSLNIVPERRRFRKLIRIGMDDNYWRCYVHPGVNTSYRFDLDDADLRFSGQELLIDTLDIKAQRSDVNVRLGDMRRLVFVDLDGYRTNIELSLPDSAGVMIEGEPVNNSSMDRFDLYEKNGVLSNDLYQNTKASFYIKADLRSGRLRLRRN